MHAFRRAALLLSFIVAGCATRPATAAPTPAGVDVRFVDDEARAVLNILDKRARKEAVTENDWARVFTSEGYVRLKAREESMRRAFEEKTFRDFVMSEELLSRREALAKTLQEWLTADLTRSAKLALAYLPAGAKIRAKVYPVIKPATNSFVFDLGGDPAIFMYIETQPRNVFEAIIAHEMHHIGFAANCPSEGPSSDLSQWMSAFGEGIATLAAAGGPSGPPQLKPKMAAEWTSQMAKFDQNFRDVEQFLLSVKRGELSNEEQQKKGFSFFGIVGAWYTVGWRMGVVIEEMFGREELIRVICNRAEWLGAYNRAALEWQRRKGEALPRWSAELMR